MRLAMVAAFVVNAAFTLGSLLILPERVAIHFGMSGAADDWASSSVLALILLGAESLLFLMFFFTPIFVFALPPSMINLPNKDYWLAEENRPRAREVFGGLMSELGLALFLFLLVVNGLVVWANLATTAALNMPTFITALVLLGLYTVYWNIRLVRAFGRPVD